MGKIITVILFLFLACLEAGAISAQASPGGGPPHGLYVYSYPRFIQNGEFDRALAIKGVDGAAVVMRWAELEPERGHYEFGEFDRRVELIHYHRTRDPCREWSAPMDLPPVVGGQGRQ